MRRLRASLIAPALVTLIACSGVPTAASRPESSVTPHRVSSTPTPFSSKKDKSSWKKPRYISVAEAVERLQPHVDVPVVLPRDRLAGLPNLKGWLADPRYLDWRTVDGVRAGGMTIRKGKQILILSYGLAGFDGCGDRTMAIETNVLGFPALATQAREHLWSFVLWPVTETGSTGRYGIRGTFDAVAMIRLAESMELARLEALDVEKSC